MRHIAIISIVLLAGCASPALPPAHDYTLAILTAGPQADALSDDTVATASAGHRAHIESMGADGTLLLAGPFGEPRASDAWRGLYVFDLSDMAAAHDLAQADPAVVAGLFDIVLMPWRSDRDLRPLRDEIERGKAKGEPFVPAAYVLAMGEPTGQARAALKTLSEQQRVICAGGLGGERQGQQLALLTAETVGEAGAWLGVADPGVQWQLSSLWATALLGNLASQPSP